MQVNMHAVLRVTPVDGSPLEALHALAVTRGLGEATVVDESDGSIVITLDILNEEVS